MSRKVYIYSLSDKSGIRYIGQTTDLKNRLRNHFYISLDENSPGYNYPKSKWIRKRKDEVKIDIIEECNINNYKEREIYWISFYSGKVKLLNCTKGGEGTSGYKKTILQRINAGNGHKGLIPVNKGKRATAETLHNMSVAQKNRYKSGAVIWNKGKSLSEEHIKKLSESRKGRNVWNKGLKGCQIGPRKGVKVSEETKEKMRISALNRKKRNNTCLYFS